MYVSGLASAREQWGGLKWFKRPSGFSCRVTAINGWELYCRTRSSEIIYYHGFSLVADVCFDDQLAAARDMK